MIKVLYVTCFKVSPYKGGTERTTDTIVKELSKTGEYIFYNAYIYDIAPALEVTKFEKSIRIETSGNNFKEFLLQNGINIIILQGSFHLSSFIKKNIKELGDTIKLIAAHHYNPGAEDRMLPFSKLVYRAEHSLGYKEKVSYLIKAILFPIYSYYKVIKNKKMYRITYTCADKVILLSDTFKNDFIKYSGINDSRKLSSIPNALSYNDFADELTISAKERIVLIVARMEEYQKRISLALKTWERISKEKNLGGWKLVIVGNGDDLDKYKQMANTYGITKSVCFEGFQNPLPYYQRSSIFLMTSRFEGWGITLTEAMQWGCVPVAVNSYSSLTDIIDDGINGFVVKENAIDDLVNRLDYVMNNEDRRNKMAICAIQKSKKFLSSEIANMWNILIHSVCPSI